MASNIGLNRGENVRARWTVHRKHAVARSSHRRPHKDPWETLDERPANECNHLAANIEELQRSIEGVLKEVSDLQNEFEFVNELTGSERDQRQRDLEALRNSAPARLHP